MPRLIDALRCSLRTVGHHPRPGDVAVTLYHGVGSAQLVRFLGVECGVDAAEDDVGPVRARQLADFIPAQGVGRMDPDPHDVAPLELGWLERLERFVGEDRIAPLTRRRRREHIQPPRGDDRHAERDMAGVDEMDTHCARLRTSRPCPRASARCLR